MPFALVIIGLIMIVSGSRDTHVAFAKQLQADMTGPGNFITWIVALGVTGSVGYIRDLQSFSRYFMALIIIGLVLSNRGFFAQFNAALASGPVASVKSADNTPTVFSPTGEITTAVKDAATQGVKDAATGNNPGSDMIGTWTTQGTQWLKNTFGLPFLK